MDDYLNIEETDFSIQKTMGCLERFRLIIPAIFSDFFFEQNDCISVLL